MLLACVQTGVAFGSVESNLNTVLLRLGEAAEKGADLVVFPECMLSGYAFESRDEALPHAVTTDSAIFNELTEAARKHQLHLTLGFLERDGNRLFNAAALVGPGGIVSVYRKIHLPGLGVDRFVDRGDRAYRTVSAGDARIGLAICYDSSFPEPIRVLGLDGADVIALGTNWPVPAQRTAIVVPPARSMENHLYFCAANRVGTERGFTFCGKSSICGPDGITIASTDGDNELILYAEADLNLARNKRIERTPGRHVIDRFADRRPEVYGPLCADPSETAVGKRAAACEAEEV